MMHTRQAPNNQSSNNKEAIMVRTRLQTEHPDQGVVERHNRRERKARKSYNVNDKDCNVC